MTGLVRSTLPISPRCPRTPFLHSTGCLLRCARVRCKIWYPALRATPPGAWYDFNLDRWQARRGLAEHPPAPCRSQSTGGD